MSYATDKHLPQCKFSLELEINRIEKLAGKYEFAAKVTKVWDDGAAQDVTHLVHGLHEHWGADRDEARAKAIAEAERVLSIQTGEVEAL